MTIEERLHQVELELTETKRRNRWILSAMALTMLVTLTVAATGAPTVLRATRFQMVDASSNVRAELGMGKLGPALLFLDGKGKPNLTLTVVDGEPFLMASADGKIASILSLGKDYPKMKLADQDGNVKWSAP